MTIFWITAIVLTLLVAGAFLRAIAAADETGDEARDIDVYRDQLKDVERDVARGVLSNDAADAVRLEIQRRILSADKSARKGTKAGSDGWTKGMIVVTLAVLFGATVMLYLRLGAPAYPDLPLKERLVAIKELRETRPSQAEAAKELGQSLSREAEAEPAYVALVVQLRAAMETRPNSLEGFQRLAGAEAALGNYTAASKAALRVIELKGAAATAADYRDYGELLILAVGGYVSPEAEQALAAALSLDPGDGAARYYSGLMFAQTGRPDQAFRLWRTLLDEGKEGDPWLPPITSQIERVAEAAGIPFELSRDQSAAGMSAEERNEMIQGMVTGLAERLAEDGGPASDWARLIRAYGVLGETDKAREIWSEAQTVFAEDAQGLAEIRAEAEGAGVAE